MNEYQKSEAQLTKILREASSLLSKGEKEEVRGYIGSGEYSEALETLIDMLSETGKPLSSSMLTQLRDLAEVLELGTDACTLLRKLGKC